MSTGSKPGARRAQTPGASTPPVVDFSALEQIAELARANRTDFAAHVVEVFLGRIEEVGIEVAHALEEGDAVCIRERAHEIASSSAQVGAIRLASACQRLAAAAGMPTSDLKAEASDFLTELEAARDALRAHFIEAEGDSAASTTRILIVDDDPTALLIMSHLIERSGYVVESAPDGLAALERLESNDFDAMITDLSMPRMDGRELCERLRSQDRWRDLPILVTTGVTGSDQLAWLEGLTSVELFEKPIAISELIGRLDGLLRPSTPR